MAIKWDENTAYQRGGFKDFENDIAEGIKAKVRLKSLEAEVKMLKEQVDNLLGPAFGALGLETAGIKGVGAVKYMNGTSASIVSGKGVIEYLVSHGVDVDLAMKAVNTNTKPGKKYKYFKIV